MDLVYCGFLALSIFCGITSAERCPEYGIFNTTYYNCDDGCCYSYIYPCCENYFYETEGFKISIGLAVASLVVTCLCVAIRLRLRGQRARVIRRANVTVPAVSTVCDGPAQPNTRAPFSGYNTNYGADFSSPHLGFGAFNSNPSGAEAPPAYGTLPPAYNECVGSENKTGLP